MVGRITWPAQLDGRSRLEQYAGSMLAVRPLQTGGPEVMKLEEHPTPVPGPGEALVRIEAAGVNFIDIYQRSGQYKVPTPMPLGMEGAGVVEAVHQGVSSVQPGDRVAWASWPGSYATEVCIAAERLVPVPDEVELKTAAAAMLQGMTAHYLCNSTYPLRAGETCLVHAAAGGVGLLLTQMAKKIGARVIGTVSTEAKAQLAREAGADEVILYSQVDFLAETKRLTEGKGVAVAYDSIGKDTWLKSLDCLSPRGMLALYGQSSGAVPPFDPQLLAQKGSLFFTRPTLGHYVATREELLSRAGDVLGAIRRGALNVTIGGTYALAGVAEAHRALAARETTGKLVLIP
jgi:NADPH2:quinone reductase